MLWEFQPLRGRLPADQRTDQRRGDRRADRSGQPCLCEVYLDGLGWIPVDVTPGCYYDTFALLQMAEQPQDIEMTAALKDSEDPGELLDDLASQPTEPQTPLLSPVSGVLGAILLLCDFVLFLLIVLEVRRQLRDKPLAAALERRFGAG